MSAPDVPPPDPRAPAPAAHPSGGPQGRPLGPRLGIWQLAWPAIVANLLQASVGMIDIKIVGSLGAPAVAAVTTGQRVFFVVQGVLMAITAGTTALVARAWGAGDRAEAERVNRVSLSACAALAALLSVPGLLFAEAMAGWFRIGPEAVELGATFIRWMSVFQVAFAVQFVLGTSLRAAGDMRTPLVLGALTNVVNVVLLYALVYGRLGFPALGVAGAAIANGSAFALGSAVFVTLWARGDLLLGFTPPRASRRALLRRLVRIGYPAGLEQLAWQGGFIGFLWIVSLYGTAPYAAYGIGVTLLAFSFVVGFGFSIATSTLVGQHLGAGDAEGAARSGWRSMWLSIGAMVVFGLAIVASARPLARFLIDDPEVVRLTVVFIRILGSVQPLMAIEFALAGALRGAGDTRFPFLTVLTGLVGVRLGIAALCVWLGGPVEWVYAALIADYAVKASLLVARFRGGRWRRVLEAGPR